MKRIRSIIIIQVFLLISAATFAQDDYKFPQFIPPSPDAAALGRYGEIPVSYCTGVPQIEVPIYTLKCGELQVPISISYHASGIKVRDMATPVGLGWVMNSGGLISRTIVGQPDEFQGKPSFRTSQYFDDAPKDSYGDKTDLITKFQSLIGNVYDVQSDRYTYNFNGHSGVLVNDYITDSLHTVPYRPLSIVKFNPTSGTDSYYVITDEQGIQYTFSGRESSVTTAQSGGITSWYLTKMVSPNSDEVDFYYSNSDTVISNFNFQTYTKGSRYIDNGAYGSLSLYTNYTPSQSSTEHKTIQLDSIVSRSGCIYFNYVKDRVDGRKTRLDQVLVKDVIGRQTIESVSFYQGYFGTSDGYKRLKLDSVKIEGSDASSPKVYSFHYINSTEDMPTYYQVSTMQMYTNFVEDFWGYYNRSNSPTLIPGDIVNTVDPTVLSIYKGDRNPRTDLMSTYTLDEIHYPTGGKTTFQYECNNVGDGNFYTYPNSNNGNIGGLRIKSISNYGNDTDPPLIRSYEYDLPSFDGITPAHYTYKSLDFYYNRGYEDEGWRVSSVYGTTTPDVYLSTSTIPASLQDESPVNYGKVIEYLGTPADNVGKTVYQYSVPPDFETDYIDYGSYDPRYAALYHVDKGIPVCYLENKSEYKNVDGNYQKVHEMDYSYNSLRNSSFLTGIRVNQVENFVNLSPSPTGDPWWDIDDFLGSFIYENTIAYTEVNLIAKTDEYNYGQNEAEFTRKTTAYYYDTTTLQIAYETSNDSKGETIVTNYRRPFDYYISGSPSNNLAFGILNLQQHHLLSPVIEKYVQKSNADGSNLRTIFASLTSYEATHPFKDTVFQWESSPANDFIPANITASASMFDSRYKPRLSFDVYDSFGNILQDHKVDDLVSAYCWDYNKTYPIAKVVNATQTDIGYTSFEADGTGGIYLDNNGAGIVSSDFFTGRKSCLASEGFAKFNLDPAKTYIVSLWAKNGTPNYNGFDGSTQVIADHNDWTRGKTINGWTYLEKTLTGVTTINVGGGPGLVDELRFYPVGAQMTTYTYDPLVGMTSQCDLNNRVTYYSYDALGRLNVVRDQDGNIVKTYQYHYKGQ